jgi:hypothetical protein
MQTLEREPGLGEIQPYRRARSRRAVAFAVGAAAVLLIVAGVAYAVGSGNRTTKTVTTTITKTITKTVRVGSAASAVNDRGFSKLDNGHQAATNVFQQPLDPATRQLLQHQLEIARDVAMRYPTVRDAEAAGWRRAGPFAPGLGAHYFKWGGTGGSGFTPIVGTMSDATVGAPASLIYDGTRPDSRIAGLMYLGAGMRIPAGFAGTNDIWHYHTNVCTVFLPGGGIDTPFGADTTVTKSMCDGAHGLLEARTPYMLHVWVVPGYDSPQGVFSHLNEAIMCRDGSYNVIPLARIGTRSSVCVDGGE